MYVSVCVCVFECLIYFFVCVFCVCDIKSLDVCMSLAVSVKVSVFRCVYVCERVCIFDVSLCLRVCVPLGMCVCVCVFHFGEVTVLAPSSVSMTVGTKQRRPRG